MRVILAAFAFLSLTLAAPAVAEELGEHPAIIAQRLHAAQGYDYASKFYPHPAWLYLSAEAPRTMVDHPAVIVAKRRAASAAVDNVAKRAAVVVGAATR